MLEIRMLGDFSIKTKNADISDMINRSKRLRAMLAFLIANQNREVSQEALVEVLWPNEDIENPANTLKTILHRARTALGELGIKDAAKCITYRRGAFSWTPTVPCFVDIAEFERLFAQAEAGDVTPDERAELYLQAAALYTGDFLPKNALEMWAIPLSGYYRTRFITAVCNAADYLISCNRYEEVVPLCRQSITIDPYEEHFHMCLIRALVACGNRRQAVEHYDYVTALFFGKFGITPSQELTALYTEIVRTSREPEINLRLIVEDLAEKDANRGCFFCEYEQFRTVYRLEARAAARNGQVVYICLMTIADALGHQPKLPVLNRAMERLKGTVTSSLRNGDVFTRYSVNQYLAMLPTNSFESSDSVMRRISDTFRRDNPKLAVILSYSLHPVIPAELAGER